MVRWVLCCGWLCLLAGCRSAGSTAEIPAVAPFELERYLGVWHEAARMPRWFERGMECVRAEYCKAPDGSIRVRNSGICDGKRQEATGVIRQKIPGTGELEVSFFRPFYGAYRIVALAPDYSAALVVSGTKDSAWILVRAPARAKLILPEYLALLKQWGYDCSRMEFPPMTAAAPAGSEVPR